MTTPSAATAALLELIRWPVSAPAAVDWAAVQSATGARYPAEFREVAEALPPGQFQTFLSLLHPAGFPPDEYADEIHGYAQMLGEPDLVPWAVVGMDYVIAWRIEGDDPDAWPVVVCDSRGPGRVVHRLSTAGFLRAVLTVPTPVEELTFVAEAQQPPSYVANDGRTSAPAGPDEEHWNREAEGRELLGPEDCVDELRDLVTPAPITITVPRWYTVWSQVQGKIGWPPPPDYKHLIEELGAIKVGPVTVAAPGGPVDLVKTYDKLRRRVVKQRAAGGGPAGTVWPEPRGVMRWGDLEGGGHVCWLTYKKRPEFWPVIVFDAELSRHRLHMMSASRFLLEVATNPEHPWGG
ncbi:hypothetical protein BJ973_008066 [Actinoplanes tereljensis]|uniref:Knr4/Smi1-like domain-containing protein n=1 Tax=Paractinoplanes tereljensis TaxID=571912 RepID=A0A919NVP5_9ACTN|nr:hypothetical protein [Actinoplanes tereljensis]GIF24587.1 hypothetical protein Ate02nite_73170 [Actinoplanes tereljensis]